MTNSKKRPRVGRRGVTVVFAAILMIVIMGMAAFAIDLGYLASMRNELQRAADASALAGASALQQGPSQALSAALVFAEANVAATSGVVIDAGEDIELGTWDEDTANFQVLNPAQHTDADAVRVTCRVNRARGNAPTLLFARVLGQRDSEITVQAVAIIRRSKCGRIVGLNEIQTSDGLTDSYDSSLGSYHSQNPGNEGHICSNGPIHVHSGCIVDGDATPGPNHMVAIGSNGTVTGETTSNKHRIVAPPIDPGTDAVVNDNFRIPPKFWDQSGNVEVKSKEILALDPGVYYIEGDLATSGQGGITTSGPTTIYVTGQVDISGQGIVNQTQQPQNLLILPLGSNAKFSGSSALHADIYGPTCNIDFRGQGGLFGGILGRNLSLNGNTAIHADMALGFTKHSPVEVRLVQ